MLRLRSRILAHLLSSPATYPHRFPHPPSSHSTLHRLLSAAASPHTGFAVEEYLVETCGLTRAQALKASAKLSHLKSPSKPDAVLAFLAGLGLSAADIATAVARDPRLLCAGVEKILAPNVVGLAGLGLSHSQIARLVPLAGPSFRHRSIVSKLPYYYQSLVGSYEDLLRALKYDPSLLRRSLDKVIKPNVAFLRECGLDDCGITKLCRSKNRIVTPTQSTSGQWWYARKV
jgi:mTERF domain-containing protein, mitochondrial